MTPRNRIGPTPRHFGDCIGKKITGFNRGARFLDVIFEDGSEIGIGANEHEGTPYLDVRGYPGYLELAIRPYELMGIRP